MGEPSTVSGFDQRIKKVPLLLLKEKNNSEDYIPKVVSIGPHHHGEPELHLAEAFKPKALELFVSGGKENQEFYYNKVLEKIHDIRECYQQQSTDTYSDHDLARMMLLDACFIIIHMEASTPEPEKQEPEPMMLQKIFSLTQHLGMLTMTIVLRDLFLLENQIPIWIVKLLIKLRYEKDDGEKLLNRYLNMTLFGEYRKKRSSPHQNREEPLHLLEAFRRLVVSDCVKLEKTYLSFIRRWFCCFRFKEETGADPEIGVNQTTGADPEIGVTDPEIGANQTTGAHQATDQSSRLSKLLSCVHKIRACVRLAKESYEDDAKRDIKKYVHSFRSATDLKAKGIHFKPSSTQSLMDVKFKSKFIYAQLELPTWGVSIYTKVFFLNMIAYELSPNNPNMGEVTSYINLMKSLIESPADVKELREKKILYNMLGSDEEVLNVYKDINTYGANNPHIFQDVKDKIQAHYNSKTKTWIAELIHTHFRTPWTLITLLAAMVLLALTAVQVHYAIPHKSNK